MAILTDLKYYIKISTKFIKDLPEKIQDWFIDVIIYFKIAFTNWDSEIYNIKDEIIRMIRELSKLISIITSKAIQLFRELTGMIKEILTSLRGWG